MPPDSVARDSTVHKNFCLSSPQQVFRAQSEPEPAVAEPASSVEAGNLPPSHGVYTEPTWFIEDSRDQPLREKLPRDVWSHVVEDHRNFYGRASLTYLALAFGGGAAMANTNFDQEFEEEYQRDFRSRETDRAASFIKPFGNGLYTIPVLAGAAAWNLVPGDIPGKETVGEWGGRGMRTLAVGAPFMLVMQQATGGSRPNETSREPSSHWNFFQDNNGVSGHAFVGAVPFLTAARMTENPLLKTGLYAASALPGISRLNDDAHYFSQVCLGWFIAFAASAAIDTTQTGNEHFSLVPIPIGNGIGLGMEFRR